MSDIEQNPFEGEKITKPYRISRQLYVWEAAFEYLISLLFTDTLLAQLTSYLGCSDSLTGIISSIIHLGCLFQLFSILLRGRRMKRFVIIASIANQCLFLLLYIIPLTNLPKQAKIVAFVVILIAAYFIYYVAHPKKINWLMSLVEDKRRGNFTATKEIVSLIVGIVFSWGMGKISDHFNDAGNTHMVFILFAGVVLVLMVVHTLTMLFSIEPEIPAAEKKTSFWKDMGSLLKDKNLLKIALVFVLWHIATGISGPFFGVFKNNTLGFSLSFSAILSSVSSVSRILVSRPLGKFADKHTFSHLICLCLCAGAVAYGCIGFLSPNVAGNAFSIFGLTFTVSQLIFALYFVFHGFAMAGINSSLTNLIFDHVSLEKRADALAICQALAGTAGFLATLAGGVVVDKMQAAGNTFFSVPMYPQQLLSRISSLACIIAILFVLLTFLRKKKKAE